MLLFVSSGVTMTVPFAMGKIIDIIYTENENDTIMKETLTSFSKILCGVFLVGAVANAFRVYLIYTSGTFYIDTYSIFPLIKLHYQCPITFLGERIIYNLRYKLFQSITNQEIAFFDKRGTGELVNRLSGDTSLVGHAITYKVSDGLRALVQGTAGMSMMVIKLFIHQYSVK